MRRTKKYESARWLRGNTQSVCCARLLVFMISYASCGMRFVAVLLTHDLSFVCD